VHPPASEPPTTQGPKRRQPRKLETATERKPERRGTTRQAVGEALPLLTPDKASRRDTALMVGGLALVVLLVCDVVFLTLSARALRSR